jgi:hypothetical protein
MDWPKPSGNLVIDVRRVANLGAEPVSLAEAKEKLRVTFSDDDNEITALITRARKFVENYCNISIVYQRIQAIVNYSSEWYLPFGPVIGIESVADSQSNCGSGPITYESSTRNWRSDGDLFDPGGCYRMRIVYTAGMVPCPEDLKDVVLQVIVFLYENRGREVSVEDLQTVLHNADSYKVMAWI